MVIIRLARGGAKKRPFYNIVATDSRNRRDGRYIERLGYFNPTAVGGETRLVFDSERVDYWRSKGAQVSQRVTTLLGEEPGVQTGRAKSAERAAKAAPVVAAKVEKKEEAVKAEPEATEAKDDVVVADVKTAETAKDAATSDVETAATNDAAKKTEESA